MLLAAPAFGQSPAMFGQGSGKPALGGGPAVIPPPALPGAASPRRGAAPATRPPTDMAPTDALFDAINRGDIATARDAVGRGADLRGVNVLGMTPLELSIDLGRNDISFMLLSMRGADDATIKQGRAEAAKPTTTRQAQAKPAPQRQPAARVAATAPTPSQTARLFSGDGGAPNPNAGFLGFDASRR